jgi:DHA1 family bicyclomycin/chloramphenicol resistance-like MFS transporter
MEFKEQEFSSQRFLVPTLAVAYFSSSFSNIIVSLLAVDIAKTFFGDSSGVAMGLTSQLNTLNAVATVVFAIALSFLAIRFKYKSLLILGIAFVFISAIGSFLAPTLFALQIFFAIEGAGSITVWIIATTIIGDVLSQKKKAKAISYIISIGYAAMLISIVLVNSITSVAGWRSNFLFLVLPFSILSLAISVFIIPSKNIKKETILSKIKCFDGFRQILRNKSALACLITTLLTLAQGQIAIFAIAFYRIRFSMPREWATIIYEIAALIFIISPIISGRIVNRVGAKRLALTMTSLSAICLSTFFFIPNLYGAIALDMLHIAFGSAAIPAFIYLVLEQTPDYRGTMMSLNSIFNNAGNAIGPAIGGALLILTSGFYPVIGLAFGLMTFTGAAVLLLFVKDTTNRQDIV